MNGITHKQAKQYILADLDELLTEAGRYDLQTHLVGCETCRTDFESLTTLTARLQAELHSRWDVHDGPSTNVLNNIRSQSRRIMMSNRINSIFRTLASITALLILGLSLNYLIKNFQTIAQQPTTNTATVEESPTSELAPTFRFVYPVENKEQALIAVLSALKRSFTHVAPLGIVTVKQESYGEYAKEIGQPLNSPADLKIWFILYFNEEWQNTFIVPSIAINDQGLIVTVPPDSRTPHPPFRGCVVVVINANDGSPVEVGGPLQEGLIPECDK